MLLYLTSNENIGLFDFLTEETGMLVKKLSGEFILKNFIIYDMKNLDLYSYVAIDLAALNDAPEDIIEAIIAFKTMYNTRLILFAENGDNGLLNRLITETECYNIVTSDTIDGIQEEIRICMSPQGMSRDYILKTINKDVQVENFSKYSFSQENVKIMVAGAMNRVGTTTTAINMANFLAKIGAKVSYTEANDRNHLLQIHSYFFPNIPIVDNYFSYKGVDYFLDSSVPIDMGYNFAIVDIGILKEKNLKVFGIGDVKVLCGGTKPYEITELVNSLKLVDDIKIDVIVQLIEKGEMQNVRRILSGNRGLYFNKSSLNLFDSNINEKTWESILSEYIVEHETL
ncbi:hypothetical protein [Sporanaerobacter acetigenes]|uniref:hypothetical protein n=1 Tax=Sporanaerobacter acetigenes TaxID=165813 RepID=UPI0009330553|nr:hypothetical protein [Sporanaerobacter acetigenes]